MFFNSRWSTNKGRIFVACICLKSWTAEHSKQYMKAWMKNNCSRLELIMVTICIFSCVSLLCPCLWSALRCHYQMTCIDCAPLIALPAWHLASFPLPGSQDLGEVLSCLYLSFPCTISLRNEWFLLSLQMWVYFGFWFGFFFPSSKG